MESHDGGPMLLMNNEDDISFCKHDFNYILSVCLVDNEYRSSAKDVGNCHSIRSSLGREKKCRKNPLEHRLEGYCPKCNKK